MIDEHNDDMPVGLTAEFLKIKAAALEDPTPANLAKVCECYDEGLGVDPVDPESVEFHIKLGNAYREWKSAASTDWLHKMLDAYESAWQCAEQLGITHEPFMQSFALRVGDCLNEDGIDSDIISRWYVKVGLPELSDTERSASPPIHGNGSSARTERDGTSGSWKKPLAIISVVAFLALIPLVIKLNASSPGHNEDAQIPIQTQSSTPELAEELVSDYIFPTDTQYITFTDLSEYSRETITLIRNEIYARHGYTFQTDEIREYFMSQAWYHPDPDVNASTFNASWFNEYEQANVNTIIQYEKSMGWRQ